jgi:hypothetical protein
MNEIRSEHPFEAVVSAIRSLGALGRASAALAIPLHERIRAVLLNLRDADRLSPAIHAALALERPSDRAAQPWIAGSASDSSARVATPNASAGDSESRDASADGSRSGARAASQLGRRLRASLGMVAEAHAALGAGLARSRRMRPSAAASGTRAQRFAARSSDRLAAFARISAAGSRALGTSAAMERALVASPRSQAALGALVSDAPAADRGDATATRSLRGAIAIVRAAGATRAAIAGGGIARAVGAAAGAQSGEAIAPGLRFARPHPIAARDRAPARGSRAGAAAITLNSTPNITVNVAAAADAGGEREIGRAVADALEQHAERIYEMVARFAAIRERTEF